jgi:phosphoglycerol transferase MdoB-like AlkP superfamily enzyme
MALRNRLVSSVLVLGAVVLLLLGAFWPVMVALPGQLAQILTVIAAVLALCGGYFAPREPRLAIASLWAAFGIAAALGVVGVWSGLIVFYAPAALLLAVSILATPYESEFSTRWDAQFVLIFAVVYAVTFMAALGSGVSHYDGMSAASEQTYYVTDRPGSESRLRHRRPAKHSNSTSESRGNVATWTVERGGGSVAE